MNKVSAGKSGSQSAGLRVAVTRLASPAISTAQRGPSMTPHTTDSATHKAGRQRHAQHQFFHTADAFAERIGVQV